MTATLGDIMQLLVGVLMVVGVSVTMEKNGVSVFERESRTQGLCVLTIFCSAWVIGMTLLAVVFGE